MRWRVPRRSRPWLAAPALLAVVAVAAACGAGSGGSGGPSPASPVGSGSTPTSPVEGIVVKIDATGLTNVAGFTLRTNSGQEIQFKLGTLENATQFAPGHLGEHVATASPVRVFFRATGGDLVVYRLEDAP